MKRKIGSVIRECRDRLEMSGQILSAKLGYNPGWIFAIEEGKRPGFENSIAILEKIAGSFNLTASELLKIAETGEYPEHLKKTNVEIHNLNNIVNAIPFDRLSKKTQKEVARKMVNPENYLFFANGDVLADKKNLPEKKAGPFVQWFVDIDKIGVKNG